MDLSIPPFSLQLPSGYGLSAGSSGTQGGGPSNTSSPADATSAGVSAGASSANPVDVISLSDNAFAAGNFNAIAGDTYRMSDLFKASAPTGQAVVGYRVALGGGDGKLLNPDGSDVAAGITSFTAEDFAKLTYKVGKTGSQSVVVIAQTGTRNGATINREIDSAAVQITATVAGSRSINAMNALSTRLNVDDADAGIASSVQAAAIFTGWTGSVRPSLQTAGNFTAVAGDTYRMSNLFTASAPAGQTIVGYRVAVGGGDGKLVNPDDPDAPVNASSFTAEDFAKLTYKAGTTGSQNLVVVAQTGTLSGSTISREIDSAAVQITANVTGNRSINVASALTTPPGTDADIASIVTTAGIFTGWTGSARSSLQTDGNFTAVAGDIYRMGDLFNANAPAGQTVAGFRVALGDVASGDVGGKLWLGATDVTSRTSFSADELSRLTYATTDAHGPQSLVVVAQTGTRQPNLPDGTLGALSREVDSPAVQITANVVAPDTVSRSINAMNALITKPKGADAAIAGIVQQAGIFTGWTGADRSTLQTAGNFTAVTGDIYRMDDLFKASAPAGQTIVGFRVALGDAGTNGGTLLLDGMPVVAGTTSFTAEQFARLTYDTTGAKGLQSLLVVAQTGTRQPVPTDSIPGTLGALIREIDSPAVQITAHVIAAKTGSRSINVARALANPPGTDAAIAGVVSAAGIFTGWTGSARSAVETDGNFTAIAGDVYRMSDLFKASAPAGQMIAGFRVALGDPASGDAGGVLWLDKKDVSKRTSFSADEFARLTYDTTSAHGTQSLVVVAQTGTRQPKLADGTLGDLSGEIDGTAVQITAKVIADATGSRSINAMNALVTMPVGADSVIASIVQQAGIFTGWTGAARSTLQTDLAREPPISQAALADATGTYRSAGLNADNTDTDLSSYYSAAIGSSVTPGLFAGPGGALATALLLLDGAATGAFQTDSLTALTLAIRAYNATKSF